MSEQDIARLPEPVDRDERLVHRGRCLDVSFLMEVGEEPWLVQIRAGRCLLYLLTGEDDYSCTPDDTHGLARLIPGARATIMDGMGHFPMSEDPDRFLTYLRPVLDEIAGR